MSKFKVGDRVKLNGSIGGWCFSNEGKTGTITRITHEWTYVTFDNSKGDPFEDDFGNPEFLQLISRAPETPPATITHEGYTYNRGERVRPEWLKDGAWVVNVGTGDLRQVKEVSPGVFDLTTGTIISIRYGDHIRDQYRPHEPSDYKWGDWAMYDGEKVFVMGRKDGEYIFVSHADFIGGHAYVGVSSLTPTHAP